MGHTVLENAYEWHTHVVHLCVTRLNDVCAEVRKQCPSKVPCHNLPQVKNLRTYNLHVSVEMCSWRSADLQGANTDARAYMVCAYLCVAR